MNANSKPQNLPNAPVAITQLQLAELACRLVQKDGETAEQVVRRALNMWEAAGDLLAKTGAAEAGPSLTFKDLAEDGLVPSTREKTGVVGTEKGVHRAVERFFDVVLAGYDPAMKGRLVMPEMLRDNKAALKKLRENVLQQHALCASQLALVQQFQIASREKTKFAVTPELIRDLLKGADVGQPGFDL